MAAPATPHWENAFSVIEPQINAAGVHVWPFEASFPLDVSFFDFDLRRGIRMNRHDYFEVLYLCSGELDYQVQERTLPMRAGDLVVISSTHYHTMRPPAARPNCRHVKAAALYFLPELIRSSNATSEEVEYLMPFLLQDDAFPHVIPGATGVPAEALGLMRRIRAELPAADARSRLAAKTYLKMILVLLGNHYASYRSTAGVFQQKQQAIERLRPLFAYLEERYAAPLTVADAASVAGMSQSHFMRFFKQVTGQSFINYLTHFRVAKAEELLARTDLSIAEVSQAVGFCDQSYFSLVFRRLTRLTPLQYKKRFAPSPTREAEPSSFKDLLVAPLHATRLPEATHAES
jgi:AraC-like DNA-binding protein/mannose-6-phosphate isomerase-like protein (cupin superfamily)